LKKINIQRLSGVTANHRLLITVIMFDCWGD